jgi:hypothetical protein
MYLFDLDGEMMIFRAFRRDNTPEMSNLKPAAEKWPEAPAGAVIRLLSVHRLRLLATRRGDTAVGGVAC